MPNITIARHDDAFAVYMLNPDGTWTLVASGKGEDANADGVVRAVTSDGTVADIDAPHLHAGGKWAQTAPSMANATPRERLAAEVLDLDTLATQRATSAAYGGEMHDGGATGLRDRADAIRHAVLVLTGEPLPERLPSQF